ncbi:MAG: hypothetical protein CMI54_08720 [Parcubacteria group bacterium]|jgi:DNA invertase Pin-like site-specific DNA recombinase|nr:hypothetical protein [Parcubacteria group bacterium]|tara:strand:+ start:3154 stop:3666 length:513 start_codon:yes stop_codon:yes gene_type:complete
MKCAIYARVSDDKKKADGERRQDVQRQVELLKDYATRMGYKEIQTFIDDGKSAFTEDINSRPAFKALLNGVRRIHFKQVYVEDMTRFSRKLEQGLQWLTIFKQCNCNLTSLKEGQIEGTSSQGWLRSTLFLMFAEWESRLRSEKVKSGMQRAKSQNRHVGRPKQSRGVRG